MTANELKNILKTASQSISDLASSLEVAAWEEKDPNLKSAYEKQVSDAQKLSGDLDDIILNIALTELS